VLREFEENVEEKITGKEYANMRQELSSYREGIKHNFNLFCEKL